MAHQNRPPFQHFRKKLNVELSKFKQLGRPTTAIFDLPGISISLICSWEFIVNLIKAFRIVENRMHFHPAKMLISSSIMMMMAMYLIIGSLWIIFGVAFESAALDKFPSYGVVITSASIVWSAISLIISIYFIHQVRVIMKRARHERKT